MPYLGYRRLKKLFFLPRLQRIKLLSYAATGSVFAIIFLFLLSIVLFIFYSRDLPQPDRVRRVDNLSTVIYDRNGEVLYDIFSDQNRVPVSLSDIPSNLKNATLAIEDKDFYKHQGIDLRGMLRGFVRTITFQGLAGGSTLTQQLVKNALLTSERSLPRKIKEFILTVQIERKYKKDEILQMYLNEAPYGGTAWGVEIASQTYFGKHVKELDLVESAILAGLPQLPSYYSPFSSTPTAYIGRTTDVLRRMREDGYITKQQEEEALKKLKNVEFKKDSSSFKAAHFVMYVKKQLEDRFGEKMVEQGGLRVTTTLDLKLQEKVEEILLTEIDKLKGLKVSNGAVIVIDPKNGEIKALSGSKDFFSDDTEFQGKFDVATQGLRQPGSALKPITYAVAFNKGYTPSTLIMDVETHFPGGLDNKDYIPKNYDGKYRGAVQLRYALANSINIPAVKLTAWVGIKDILRQSYDMGIKSLEPTNDNINRLGLSITLGGGEVTLLDLTSAYGVFATGGMRFEPISILKVTDVHNKTLYEQKGTKGRKVLDEGIAFLISHILSDNEARKDVFGTNSFLVIPGKTVSVKTGTTDDKRDNWAVGYTARGVVGVWVGNNDNSEMDPKLASGVTGAAPIWNKVMKEVLKDITNDPLSEPSSIVSKEIDAYGGGLPKDGSPKRNEYFLKGTEPTSVSPIYRKVKVSKGDNKKLASIIDIATGQYDEKEYYVFEEKDPISTDGKNRFQEGIQSWLSTMSEEKYHPPGETSSADENAVIVSIKKPGNESQVDNEEVEIRAEASAVSGIKRMEVYIDGDLKSTGDDNDINETVKLSTGVHKIRVKAYDTKDHSGETEIIIGVKVDPKSTPSPTP